MNLEKLTKHRESILLAEIGALIHDLGKLSEEFVDHQSEDRDGKFYHDLILKRLTTKNDPRIQGDDYDLVREVLRYLEQKSNTYSFSQEELDKIIDEIREDYENKKEKLKDDKIKGSINNYFQRHNIIKEIKDKAKNITKSKEKQKEKEEKNQEDFASLDFVNLLNALEVDLPEEIGKCNLGDFIEQHHRNFWGQRKAPIDFLAIPGCDGVDSGLDKGAPVRKQSLNETYISTAFSYDKERINPPQLTKVRNQFCGKLEKELKKIERALDGNKNIDEIYEARNTIVDAAKEHFSKALGETRRAANDVTLWDHSYSVASLYKSALAGIILEDKDRRPDPSDLKWKILSVKVNGLDFWMKSEMIGDILARKKLVKNCFDKIQNLLELKIPLGNEVYRDENQIAFLVYGSFVNSLEINFDLKIKLDLDDREEQIDLQGKTIEEAIKDIFNEKTGGELVPQVQLTKEKSRGAATIGDALKKIPQFNEVNNKRISSHWDEVQEKRDDNEDLDKCHVCELRAIGFLKNKSSSKAKDRNICTVCLERRRNRSSGWIDSEQEIKTTIWMDELADKNNRVAFIIGKFDLADWINGRYLNSTLVKTISDLHNQNDGQKDLAGINTYFDLLDAAKQSFTEDTIKINGQEMERVDFLNAIGGDSYQKSQKTSTEDYFEALVINREKEILEREFGPVETWNVETKARLLISFLFRKNSSFARIRRVWETTKEFWRGCEREIKGSCLSKRQRYEIRFENEIKNITRSHTYYVKISGVFVPTVATGKNKMIIVDREDNIPSKLEEDIGVEVFESNKKDKVTDRRCSLENIYPHSKYVPYLNILKEPLSFISVIPANKAFEGVKLIKAKYEKEFSKVRNKLPFNLNLIFMKKKMPVYTALDSAKRFLNFGSQERSWKVLGLCDKERKGREFKKRVVTLNRESEFVQTTFNLKLGNGEKDYYHPYFLLERGNCPDKRDNYFETYKEEKLVHVCNIMAGDVIKYCPSHFDFQSLDSNAMRFDIVHRNEKRPHAIFNKGPRPYYLEDLNTITKVWEILNKKNIDDTQLNNFESLLIAKIEEWELKDLKKLKENTEFNELTKSSIKNILRVKDEESKEFKAIYNSVLSGMFFDVKELYKSILKQSLGGEENK